jgi:precorrin-4/cobalt-precorrin-4 C11-methyltransferase
MVHFVGAGPGDPELITVKGQRLLEEADIVIYAGSLVNRALLVSVKEGCEIYDSAGLTLGEVIQLMVQGYGAGKNIVRLHTGDPSLYGAIREQMDELERRRIPYEVIPGVSSLGAVAAALKKEYTIPGVSQTVILTRMEGRTPVPRSEALEALAIHRATMVVFLSMERIGEMVVKLQTSYPSRTPAAVVYKASWPEQTVIQGTLDSIAAKVKQAGITKTALLVVGEFLGDEYQFSQLYDENFSHGYRAQKVGGCKPKVN